MMLQDSQQDGWGITLFFLEDFITIDRMLLHDCKFLVGEPSRLIQHFIGNLGLAQIVEQPGNPNLVHFPIVQAMLLRHNHRHGRDIHAMLERIFVTNLKGADINRNRFVIRNGAHQLAGNLVCGICKILGFRIVVQILDSLCHTFLHALRQLDLGTVLHPGLLNDALGQERYLLLLRVFFTLPDIDAVNPKLKQRIYQVLIHNRPPGD